ncbi:hypothetical protein [Nostoc sp.]
MDMKLDDQIMTGMPSFYNLEAIAQSHGCGLYQVTENTDIAFDYLFWWD